jgi:protein-S-isoprenylcysteine O-methyltransferase Ste14
MQDVSVVLRTGTALLAFTLPALAPSQDWTWPAPWLIVTVLVFLVMIPGFLYIRAYNPDLIQERERGIFNPGTAGFDKVVVPLTVGLIPARMLAAGLQHRQQLQQPGWSPTPLLSTPAQQAAFAVLLAAYFFQTWAVCSNKFFSSVVRIQSNRGHRVCDTGPYAYVRHPGYIAFSLQGIAESVLLESPWAFWVAAMKLVLLVYRTLREEAFLKASLPGYAAYAGRVRYRWVPLLW